MVVRVPFTTFSRSIPPKALVSLAIAGLALAAAVGAIMLAGTKTGIALALFAVLGPVAIYAALTYPLIFPFTIFLLLVPFDNILAFQSFGTLTRMAAVASGGAIAFWMLRTRRFVTPDRVVLAWAAFYIWCIITLMWAIDPVYSMGHVFTLLQLILLYTAVAFFPADKRSFQSMVLAVIAGGTIASLYGIYLFRHGTNISSNGRLFISNDTNVIDPNQFAAALILPFALALTAVVDARRPVVKWIAGLCIVCMAGGIAVAGSRGALVAIVAAFIYLIIRSRKRVTLAAIGLGGLGLALGMYGNVLARFSDATETGGAGRADIWKVGFAAFRQHPFFGSGFSNFPLAFDRSFLSVSQAYFTRWHRAPHDLVVQTLVEIGIVGGILLGIALWNQFRVVRVVPPTHPLYPWRLALEATLIGLLCASIFLDMVENKYLWVAFMLMVFLRNIVYTTPQRNGRTA